jgi:hypothetical protein
MLTVIINLLARAYGDRLDTELDAETARRLDRRRQRIEAALAAGELDAAVGVGVGAVTVTPTAAVADKPADDEAGRKPKRRA